MIIFLVVLTLLNLALTIFFIAKFYEKLDHNSRDINAIASRLRAIEDTSHVFYAASDFRLRSLESKAFGIDDTAFNLESFKHTKQ